MLITYFKDARTLARYRSGLANLYLENFIAWLESQGYRRFAIRRHVREVVHFADWAEAEGLALPDLDRSALNRLCSQLAERNSLRYRCGKLRQICHSACLAWHQHIPVAFRRPGCRLDLLRLVRRLTHGRIIRSQFFD